MTRSTVLVTGAAGFIGSPLVEALVKADLGVVAVDKDAGKLERLAKRLRSENLRPFMTDITDPRGIIEIAKEARPAAVVHLAALHIIPVCERMPRQTVDINIGGLINTLAAADQSRSRFALFASSADVYAPANTPLAESHPTRPSSVYGTTKLLGERLVAEWAGEQDGRLATSMRIFNVYGPGDSNPHVIPEILGDVRDGKLVRVGNVEAKRDFIHVDDLVGLMCCLLDTAAPPPYINGGSGRATSVAEILAMLQHMVIRPFTWSSVAAKVRTQDRMHLEADTSKTRNLFPAFSPRPLLTGLSDMMMSMDGPDSGQS